jgi:hypothetical protein
MRRIGLTLLLATALLSSSGCVSHSMQPLPGRLASRLIVDNGVSELDGRVLYLNPARAGMADKLEVPFAGASIDVLGPDGRPLAQFPPAVTDARGRFHHSGLKVGEPYFIRARLTDPAGKPRQLYAFVLPEGRFTCVELSLASTIVAQKLAASPEQLPTVRPGLLNEMIETVRKTLSELVPPPAPPGGPNAAPPPGMSGPAVPPPPPATGGTPNPLAPTSPVWVPGPDGQDGYWWSPQSGDGGGSWWIETPCGGYWWSPAMGGTGGRWWVASNSGGRWEAAPSGAVVSAPGGSCRFNVTPPPAENCGCVWVPNRTGGGAWFLPNGSGTGGSWWVTTVDDRTGTWRPSGGTNPMDWLNGATGGLGGGSAAAQPDTVTWITLPGGQGGHWWSPTGGGPGGSWWIQTPGGGYWWTSPGTGGGTPPGNGGPCGCVWIQPPGANAGHWFLPDGNGRGGSWYVTNVTTGGGAWWHAPTTTGPTPAPSVAPPSAGGSGGAWTAVPGGGTDYVWIIEPGGGGHWWARPPAGSGGAGSWWISTGGTGGYWYTVTTGGGGVPPRGPDGSELCGCHYVTLPGSGGVGYWYLPPSGASAGSWYVTNIHTGGGSWVAADSPSIARVGAGPTPAPSLTPGGPAATPTPGTRTTVVRWVRLPGGGGFWYYPTPTGGGVYWTGTRWERPAANGSGYHWITLPGGGGVWLWPSPDGHGCCIWVPDGNGGGRWLWVLLEDGTGTPPAAPGGTIINLIDLGGLLDGLTAPTWTPGSGGGTGTVFDQLATVAPTLQPQLDQAIETILNVNVLMPFKGVNEAPFPKKDDPRYLLIGTVELRCALALEPATVSGVAYALNGKEIARTDRPLDTWKTEYDTRQMTDGDYFITAHEAAPGQAGLGKLLAKGYARIRNTVSSDAPCADQWD